MWGELVGKLRDEAKAIAEDAMNHPQEFHLYRQTCGKYQALTETAQRIEDILNDADEQRDNL